MDQIEHPSGHRREQFGALDDLGRVPCALRHNQGAAGSELESSTPVRKVEDEFTFAAAAVDDLVSSGVHLPLVPRFGEDIGGDEPAAVCGSEGGIGGGQSTPERVASLEGGGS